MTPARENTQLTVRILGRDYQISCPEKEREALLASAEYLSKRMSNIQKKGKTLGMERIAVMAALNIARDLIEREKQQQLGSVDGEFEQAVDQALDSEVDARLQQLRLKISSALEAKG